MSFIATERTALFIDGANLHASIKKLAFDIDYKNLLTYFRSRCHLIRAYYLTALVDEQDHSPLRPLVDWLDYNGYTMITKPAKSFNDALGHRKIKGNMDIELAIEMLELSAHIDHAVMFSGDGDFRALVEAVQRRGTKVTVVSTIQANPPMAADELRRQADYFIDLKDIANEIGRNVDNRTEDTPQSDNMYDDYVDE